MCGYRFLLWWWRFWRLWLVWEVLLISQYFPDYLLCAGDLELDCHPFPHCIIRNFLSSSTFVESLQSELMDLSFHEKSNDLYKFKQVPDRFCCWHVAVLWLRVLSWFNLFAMLLFLYSQMTWGGEQSRTLLDWGKKNATEDDRFHTLRLKWQ